MKRSQTVLMALACGFILAFPPQVHEIYRSMAEAIAIGVPRAWIEPTLSSIALVLLCWGLFYLDRIYGRPATGAGPPAGPLVPMAVAQFPIVGAAVGIFWSRIDDAALGPVRSALMQARLDYLVLDGAGTAEQVAPIADRFASNIMRFDDYLFYSSFAFGVLAVASGILLLAIVSRYSRGAAMGSGRSYLATAAMVATMLLIAAFAISGTRIVVARVLMPVPLLAMALFLAGFWLSWLGTEGRRRGFPIIICIVLAALLYSAFDLNDDHRVSTLPNQSPPSRTTVRDQFRTWLEARSADLSAFSSKKYPIYIVAAQGGGIYAAYHAAGFLATVQDDCPNFGRHIFAISGVSGGSVGGSVFASLLHQASEAGVTNVIGGRPCRKTNDTSPIFQDATDELLSEDYLTPLLGSFLFPDAFQQILPIAVPPFDRAQSLELGLEQSWQKIVASKQFRSLRGTNDKLTLPLSSSFTSLWQPARSPAPALVLNTTEVNSGQRRIIAPFEFEGIETSFVPIWSDTELARRFPKFVPNISVSTAAFLSSRFPWVTPAGYFEDVGPKDKKPVKVRVVDGGYFENSGLATALDLLSSLEAAVEADPKLRPFREKIEINIITLNSKRFDLGSFAGFGEWLSPISSMMSTRNARAPLETSRAELLVARSAKASTGIAKKLFRFDLDGLGYPLPLGWRLSPVTRLLISNQLGTRSRCGAAPSADGEISPDCLKKVIAEQLGVE
ncbi:hypothetical protein ABIB85_007503 [Bradyrhizobium sp. JR1.5]|uniref:hypothetical protein n=1 Tax=unclassified Bradyrhizobium TaxID=2631580 RepID=UPI00339462BB